MTRRASTFRQRDVERAVRAVVATGVGVQRVEIGPDGKIAIITGKPIDGPPASEQDAIDRELDEFEAQHYGSN